MEHTPLKKHKRPDKVKPQPPVLYGLIALLLRPYLRLRYGFHRPKSLPIRGERGPVTVLGNHASNIDFLFAIAALYPKRLNFLVSAYFFNQKPLCYLLRFMHCVRKEQFTADVAAIRDMRALVSAGGSILLYPEGEVNGTGRTGAFPESTARLCKLLKAPVYAVRTKGSYLIRPKWGPSRRRGRVETDVTLVATAEELPTLSNEALYTRIQAGMFQDEYAWQAQTRVPFHAKNPAEGLHLMLYRCPKCGREFAMRTERNAIFCTACGNRGLMDGYGFLRPGRRMLSRLPRLPGWILNAKPCAMKCALPITGWPPPVRCNITRTSMRLTMWMWGRALSRLTAAAFPMKARRKERPFLCISRL